MKGEIKYKDGTWRLYAGLESKKEVVVGLNERGKYFISTPFYPVIDVTSDGGYPRFWKDFTGATYIAKDDITLFEQIYGQRVMLKQV